MPKCLAAHPARPYPNYPDYLFVWNAYLVATEPNNNPPIGSQIVDGVAGFRSTWWGEAVWDQGGQKTDPNNTHPRPQPPGFPIHGGTDDLVPPPPAPRTDRTRRPL